MNKRTAIWVTMFLGASLNTNGSLWAAALEAGAAFLQLDPAARPAAMAGAYTASAGDIDTWAYNPGGLAGLDASQASFTHAEWLVDSRYDYLAFAHPTRLGVFALSATRLGYGDLEGRTAARQLSATFDAYDAAYSVAYSRKLSSALGVGGTLKFIDRKIESERAASYALDFGAVLRLAGRPLQLGGAILNVGPGTRFIAQRDPLPLTFALGAAYKDSGRIKAAVDIKHEPNDQLTTAMTGVEYAPIKMLALRAGYRLPLAGPAEAKLWQVDNFRGGLGLYILRMRLDYALTPFGDLGMTHRVSLSIRFSTPLAVTPPDDAPGHLLLDY